MKTDINMRWVYIYRTDLNGIIGDGNRLPTESPLDMFYFKAVTSYAPKQEVLGKNLLVMGRKTYAFSSISPSDTRDIAVLTRNPANMQVVTAANSTPASGNLNIFTSVMGVVNHAKVAQYNTVFICGGAEIYNLFRNNEALLPGEILDYATLDAAIYRGDVSITPRLNRDTIAEFPAFGTRANSISFHAQKYPSYINDPYHDLLVEMYTDITTGRIQERSARNYSTYSRFGKMLCFTPNSHILPPKKLLVNAVIAELVMFIKGITNTEYLRLQNVHIWDNDTQNTNWHMGPMYGYQWRNYNGIGYDQLQKVIAGIRSDPNSRRHVLTTYNPLQADQGVLYPCHGLTIQFYVENNALHLMQYQRSADVFLGLPFNILSYTFLLHMVAKLTGYSVGNVNISLGDYHLYSDHIGAVEKQLLLYNEYYRTTGILGMPEISCTTTDLDAVTEQDFSVKNYWPVNFVAAKIH